MVSLSADADRFMYLKDAVEDPEGKRLSSSDAQHDVATDALSSMETNDAGVVVNFDPVVKQYVDRITTLHNEDHAETPPKEKPTVNDVISHLAFDQRSVLFPNAFK